MFSSGRDCKNFGERFCVPDATGLHSPSAVVRRDPPKWEDSLPPWAHVVLSRTSVYGNRWVLTKF